MARTRMDPNPGWIPRIPYRNIPNNRGVGGWLNERFGTPFPKGWVGNRYVELDPVRSKDGLNIELSSKRRQELISNIYSKRRSDHERVKQANRKAANPLNWATSQMIGMFGSELNKRATERLIGGQAANVSPDQIAEFGGTGTRITNRKWDRLVEKTERDIKKVQGKHDEWNRLESIRVTDAEEKAFQAEQAKRKAEEAAQKNKPKETAELTSTNSEITKLPTDDRKIEEPIARKDDWSTVFDTLDEDGNPMVLTGNQRKNFEKEFADIPLDELPNMNRNRWIWGG